METKLSRRDFLKTAGLVSGGVLLAACQPGAATGGQTDTTTEPASTGPTPLLFWFQAENHKPEYDARKAEFEEKFNIQITYELLSRDAMTKKFPTTLMAGSGFPDIIEQNAEDIVKFLKGDDKVIPFVALDDALASGPYGAAVLENRFARYSKDGKKYGAPHDVHPIIMIYNDTEWKKFDVDMATVQTYDDLLAAMSKLDKSMPDGSPRIALYDCLSCATYGSMMLQKGIWWTNEAGESQLTTPAFKEATETWLKFKNYWTEIDWSNNVALMKSGQTMTQFIPDWFYGIYKQGLKDDAEFTANAPLKVARIPYFAADDCRTGSWGGTAASVPKLSQIGEKALEVLLYVYFENGNKQLDQRFNDTGILPPVKAAWDSDIYKQGEVILGGQAVGSIFIEAALDLPKYTENWKTPLISAAWGEQQSLVWAGSLSLDEAIKTAEANALDTISKNE